MDTILINQLVTTSGVIVAALGGAGLTSWINRRNTLDTRDAAADLWQREQSREHASWMREKKLEAYTTFLKMMSTFNAEWGTAGPGGKADSALLQSFFARYENDALLIFASDEACMHASEWATGLLDFYNQVLHRNPEIQGLLGDVDRARELALHYIREDLKVAEGMPLPYDTRGESLPQRIVLPGDSHRASDSEPTPHV